MDSEWCCQVAVHPCLVLTSLDVASQNSTPCKNARDLRSSAMHCLSSVHCWKQVPIPPNNLSSVCLSLNVVAHIQELLMGTGGVFGLTSALVGESLPGSGSSTATGNALNQGPVVFHWPQSVITELESRAHEDGEWLQLLVDLHRYVSLVLSGQAQILSLYTHADFESEPHFITFILHSHLYIAPHYC